MCLLLTLVKETFNIAYIFSLLDLKDAVVKRLKKAFGEPLTEVYLQAILAITNTLCASNTRLQTSEPMIHMLRAECCDLVRLCLARFSRIEQNLDVTDVDVDNLCYLDGKIAIFLRVW